ncbi:DUF4138 domain-containing protein [Albibacterium profundi]|uniref:DUF4138 domain-containing protein n=1 Tax=Albibacterium profundi TaxID=3134906 RepID=A0ABV5CFQ3_9SPHI
MKIIIYLIPVFLGLFGDVFARTPACFNPWSLELRHTSDSAFISKGITKEDIDEIAKMVFRNPMFHRISKDKNGKVKAKVGDITVSDNTLFYKVRLINQSNINFDIDFIRFFIRDLNVAKRTVTQERKLTPVSSYGVFDRTIEGNTRGQFVFALEKFAIAKDQALFIEIYEKKGGRHLYLKIKRSDIENARSVK